MESQSADQPNAQIVSRPPKTENVVVPDRLSGALDGWQLDDSSPVLDFFFDKSEPLDLNDPETAMKEKRGTKRSIDLGVIPEAAAHDENDQYQHHHNHEQQQQQQPMSPMSPNDLPIPQLSIGVANGASYQDDGLLSGSYDHNARMSVYSTNNPRMSGYSNYGPGVDGGGGYNVQPQPTQLPLPSIHVSDHIQQRPGSPSSGPSAQEAFNDFDGVHYAPANEILPAPPQPPPNHKGKVFYPAPVPMMLNLPRKLRNNGPGPAHPKAAPPGRNAARDGPSKRKDPHAPLKLAEKSGGGAGAVATLESILDAAADASPFTFVQHPMSQPRSSSRMQLGRDRDSSYKPMEGARRSQVMLNEGGGARRSQVMLSEGAGRSETPLPLGGEPDADGNPRGGEDPVYGINVVPPSPEGSVEFPTRGREHPDYPNLEYSDDDRSESAFEEIRHSEGSEEEEYDDADVDLAPPSNLLAELESRKAKQRLRTKNAATAFPVGMRSTLLELDAVAEIEREARKKGQTALTWQISENTPKGDDDDDVPLAMLYPTSAAAKKEENKPLGLLAVRELEENEPLSRRRQRLQHNVPVDPRAAQQSRLTMYSTNNLLYQQGDKHESVGILQAPPLNLEPEPEEEEEEETLGARRKRLQESTPAPAPQADAREEEEAEEVEETLAQRRARMRNNPEAAEQPLNASAQRLSNFMDASFDNAPAQPAFAQPSVYMNPNMALQYGYGAPQYQQYQDPALLALEQPQFDQRSRDMVERWRTNVW